MIVRIATEGQYRMPEDDAERLAELDNLAVDAAEAGDENNFRKLFDEMISLVHSDGEKLDVDELVKSDVILPPADTSFEEAKAEFTGEGLIPN